MDSEQKKNYFWIEFNKEFNIPMELTELQKEWYKNYKKHYNLN